MSNERLLTIEDLRVDYGGIHAVKGISIDVPKDRIITLIGSNGAGKSTTLRTIAGVVKATSGSICFEGNELIGKTPDEIVSMGITLVPEGRRVFENLTVLENLKIGAFIHKYKLDDDLERVYHLFPRLRERAWQLAGTLSEAGDLSFAGKY
jgi:branched-chain amino acid transport system ATP-binding protein